MSKAGKRWLFARHDGGHKAWEREVPLYRFSKLQAGELLKQLAATNMTDEQVMLDSDPESDQVLLSISYDGLTQSCGKNPRYTATVLLPEDS